MTKRTLGTAVDRLTAAVAVGRGLTILVWGRPAAGFDYDAFLHSAFPGFGIGMVMAHAFMRAPVFAGGQAHYSLFLYFPVLLLHVSTAGRVISDLLEAQPAWELSSIFNVISILLFLALMMVSVLRSRDG
ncbi:MAG: hypothetical protein ACLFWD_03455 [Anaerolineales bacterium]